MDIQEIIEWFKAAKPKPTTDDIAVQIGCHFEEIKEMCHAMNLYCDDVAIHELRFKTYLPYRRGIKNMDSKEKVVVLDALCDQIVTAIGVGYIMGFDMAGALDEVNKSNWSKFKDGVPVFDENGKIAKTDGYFKPDLAKFLKAGHAQTAK